MADRGSQDEQAATARERHPRPAQPGASALAAARAVEHPATDALGRSIEGLPLTDENLTLLDRHQDIHLRRVYAYALLVALVAQLVVTDVVFALYASLGKHWDLSTPAIDAWLTATIVEMFGIVVVVTKYLFPNRDGDSSGSHS